MELNPELLSLAVLPLRDVVFFPGDYLPIFVGRKTSVAAIDAATKNSDGRIFLVTQKEAEKEIPSIKDLFEYGVVAKVSEPRIKLPDNALKLMVTVEHRAEALEYFKGDNNILYAKVKIVKDAPFEDNKNIEAYKRSIIQDFQKCVELSDNIPNEIIALIAQVQEPGRIADLITASLSIKVSEKQKILETPDIQKRLKKAHEFLEKELNILRVKQQIKEKTEDQIKKSHKVYLLNEQLKAILKELSDKEGGEYNDLNDLENKIKKLKLTTETKEKALKELKKLRSMAPMSAEATVGRNYIDWIISLPWSNKTKTITDLQHSEKVLDDSHYGMEKVKERIIEYLAVQKRTQKIKGPILCLVGPPGVGKTSLVQSIAEATNRAFVRMSLGGVRDEAEIKGHRRTYVGAMPGKIIQQLKAAKYSNPLFLLDEIDKMGSDFRGDPAFALLEVLDSEHNKHFVDHYLEVEYDLSAVMFIATANTLDIPLPLLDRMEIIRLSGYSEEEKVKISNNYLINNLKKENGLKAEEWKISPDALKELIRKYTRESGVRNLKRELANLMRKAIKEIVVSKKLKKLEITLNNLKKYSGVTKYTFGTAEEKNLIGMTTGLAYTEAGGDLLTIEAVSMPGEGKIRSTGKLGEVMQESVQAAHSFITSQCTHFGLTSKYYKSRDIHLHVPEGATPKDGPSAGVAICTSIVSVLTGIPVRSNVAMTGEVTLRGRVLPIGGLKEKLLAALRGGVKTVIIPEENKKNLEEMPATIKKGLEIIAVRTVDEALKISLEREPKILEHDILPIDKYSFKEENPYTVL